MLLAFDVVDEAAAEHDEWHTREHLPERLSIPGFMRGSRWTAANRASTYFVLYEVETLATLESPAYLQRLDHPSPWTARMMPHYRGMRRGFCSVTGSIGGGLGRSALHVRLAPEAAREASLREWLLDSALPAIAASRGVGGVHLFESALAPAMTNEQRIRGSDAGLDWALLVTGYADAALQDIAGRDLEDGRLVASGASRATSALYRLQYMLTNRDVAC